MKPEYTKGSRPFLVYCMWNEPENQKKWMIKEVHTQDEMFQGEPWFCYDTANGITGWVGMKIWADSPEGAMGILHQLIDDWKAKNIEPKVWYS